MANTIRIIREVRSSSFIGELLFLVLKLNLFGGRSEVVQKRGMSIQFIPNFSTVY